MNKQVFISLFIFLSKNNTKNIFIQLKSDDFAESCYQTNVKFQFGVKFGQITVSFGLFLNFLSVSDIFNVRFFSSIKV